MAYFLRSSCSRSKMLLLFSVALLLAVPRTHAQVYQSIVYAGSGLSINSTSDVFTGNPTVDGVQHVDLEDAGSTFAYTGPNSPPVNIVVKPTYFDGTSIQLGSNYTFVVENETINGVNVTNSFSVFGTNVYSIAYTFVPGYNYFITVNYSASAAGTVVGLGMSLGTAGYTNNFSQMGSAMSSTYSGGGNSFMDNFLTNTFYSAWYDVYSNTTFANAVVPPLTVSSNTTGLNLEALPTTVGGTTYLTIKSISIAGVPSIAGASTLCNAQTYSINSTWPASWSASPSGIVSLSPSGNSVTVTPTGNGPVTLTASVTDPGGLVHSVSQYLSVGTPTTIVQINGANQGDQQCEGSIFSVSAASWPSDATSFVWGTWFGLSSANGVIAGQGQSSATIQLPAGYSDPPSGDVVDGWLVSLQTQNACGVSSWESTVAGDIIDCGGGGGGGNSSSMGRTLASGMGSGFNSGAGLSIFPNPADNMVNVALPDSVNVTRALITLSDIYGRQLKKVTTVSSVNPISLSGLAAGIYLVQVYDGKKLVSTSKIVKK